METAENSSRESAAVDDTKESRGDSNEGESNIIDDDDDDVRVPHYVCKETNGLDITIFDATARGGFLDELDDRNCPHLPSPESLSSFDDKICYGETATSSSQMNTRESEGVH